MLAFLVLGMLLAGLLAVFLLKGRIWLTRIFAVEFGQSDVQSNYSRTYAWLANQLGHMTLGLVTALAYFWLVETLAGALSHAGWSAAWSPWIVSFVVALVIVVLMGARNGADDRRHGMPAVNAWAIKRGVAALALLFGGTYLVASPGAAALSSSLMQAWTVTAQAADPAVLAQGTLFGLGSAAVSLSIWLTKEFCSDQRGIEAVIARAAYRRGGGDATRAVNAIRTEGLWDSVTDGFFYLTGAVLSVGIIASHPQLDTAFPESAWEIGFSVFFVLVLLFVGRSYAYRQQALDFIGAPYAARLALLGTPIAAGDGAPLSYDTLHADLGELEKTAPPRHTVIFGPPGSGKSPLAIALACEAALQPIEVQPRVGKLRNHKLRARYTTFQRANLKEAEDRLNLRYQEAMGTKAVKDTVFVDGRVLWDLRRANLLVIDNVPAAEVSCVIENQPSAAMRGLIELAAKPGLRIVWALDLVADPDRAEPEQVAATMMKSSGYDSKRAEDLAQSFAKGVATHPETDIQLIEVKTEVSGEAR
ncbi:MAG: hypothetical protein AAGE18_01250 [Pseudomonadota bacterium]